MSSNINFLDNKYKLITLALKSSHAQEKIDLKPVFEEIYLFESIFDKSMTGNITFLDVDDLITQLPIIGSEAIEIEFSSDDDDEIFSREFLVSHVDEIERSTTGIDKVITLHLIAPHIISNFTKRYIRKFDKEPHKLVKEILTDLNVKRAEIENTKLLEEPIILPNWNAFQVIDFLTDISKTTNDDQGFLFFDSASGIKFSSVKSLLSKPIAANISFEKNLKFDVSRSTNARKQEINKSFDLLNDRENGNNGQTTHYFNIETKSLEISEYQAKNQKSPTLGKTPIINSFLNGDEKTKIVSVWSKLDKDDSNINSKTLNSLNSNIRSILINGSTNIEAGMIVQVNQLTTNLSEAKKGNTLDKRLSGKSLITSIRYEIGREEFNQIIEIRKDGYEENLI